MNPVFCLTQKQADILVGLNIRVYAEKAGQTIISVWDGGDNLWRGFPSEFDD